MGIYTLYTITSGHMELLILQYIPICISYNVIFPLQCMVNSELSYYPIDISFYRLMTQDNSIGDLIINRNPIIRINDNHIMISIIHDIIEENLVIWISGDYIYDIRSHNLILKTDKENELKSIYF